MPIDDGAVRSHLKSGRFETLFRDELGPLQ